MAQPARPLSEITEEGIRLLVREMGAADAVRFLNQFRAGYRDYTEERKELFKDVTIDDVVSGIRSRKLER